MTRYYLLPSHSGDRENVPNVGIMITDGHPTREVNETVPQAKLAQQAGIAIFTIGIGNDLNRTMLADIANDPEETFVFYYVSFEVLIERVEKVMGSACQVAESESHMYQK